MANRDKQKYYWLKSDKEFFNKYKIRSLLSEKNGDTYCVILLQLKHESLNYDGVLRFSQKRAYTINELACVINRPVKQLKEALKVLEDKELIAVMDDGTIVIDDVNVGSATGQTIRKSGKDTVKNTNGLPDFYQEDTVKNTLEYRDKRLDIDDDIDKLYACARVEDPVCVCRKEEVIDRYREAGYPEKKISQALTLIGQHPFNEKSFAKIMELISEDSNVRNPAAYVHVMKENGDL